MSAPDTGFYGFDDNVPEVLTTTRLRQPKVRVPGSTTVINGNMIRDLGIMNLADIFQLVPGMVVSAVGSDQPVVTYHGTVHYEQRRMQVLVDGRTAYRTTLADVDWQSMPVPLEMIERVEVARGPNSAAYGINAFLGTINFITRDPADTAGVTLRTVRGSRRYMRSFASVGDASGDYDWRVAFEKRQSDGFDYAIKGTDRNPYHNGHEMNVVNYDSRLNLNSGFNAEFRAGVVDGINEEDQLEDGELNAQENPDIDVRDLHLQTKLNFTPSAEHFYHLQISYESFKRHQRWHILQPSSVLTCLANGTPLVANPGTCFDPQSDPFTALINADIQDSRLEFELQDTRIFSPDLKLVSGIGYREDSYTSETYFSGSGHDYQGRVFGNLEYTPIHWLTLNAGGNWERTTTTHDNYFSPRLAANFVLNSNHALRFVFSEAVRTPDSYEQSPDYGYTLRDIAPSQYSIYDGIRADTTDLLDDPGTSTLGETLEAEKIVSREISYFGQFPIDDGTFQLEVRAFNDQMRDMISGFISFETWNIDNNVAIDQKGVEVEAQLQFPGTTLRTTYGYLDQDSWYTGPQGVSQKVKNKAVSLMQRLSARHSGSVAVIQELPYELTLSSAMYWANNINHTLSQRIDFRLAKTFYMPRFTGQLAMTIQHYVNHEPVLRTDNNIEDPNQFYVEAGLRF